MNGESPEVRERAVLMVYEQCEHHESQWAANEAMGQKTGSATETLKNWIAKAGGNADAADTVTAPWVSEREREFHELKQANEILKLASAYRPGGALEQALYPRQPERSGLIYRSDRSSHYITVCASSSCMRESCPRWAVPEAATTMPLLRPSTAFTRRSWFERKAPRKTVEALEWETLNWVQWFNQTRLLEPIGHIPPADFEALYERSQQECSTVA